VAIQANSADAQQVTAAVDEVVTAFGGLDILVNNAGISTSGIAESFSLQDFDRMLAVNVRGVFVAIQRAIPHQGTGGRIVTTGSIFADRVPRPGSAVYAMTKAAVAELTRGLARELGPRGSRGLRRPTPIPIRVNSPCHAATHRSRSLRSP
jgi:3-oxoacyl-[acyl-carrier protein] reductase